MGLPNLIAYPRFNPLPEGEEDIGRGCLGNQGGRPVRKRQVRAGCLADFSSTFTLGIALE